MSTTYAYAADITKSERDENGDLIVYGKATGPDLDLDGQICDPSWLKSAMPSWMEFGNVREMHQPIAAGVGIELEAIGDDWWLKSKCVDPGTAAKIEAGVLKGYSIGINSPKVIKDAGAPGGRIVGGIIVETSYVDRPCNPTAKMAICKMAGGELQAVEAPAEPEPVEDTAKGVDADLVKRGTDLAAEVRALLPDLDKAAPEQDIADAQAAIAAVARLIMSEAEGLAAGRMGEAYQISTLLDAVCALKWFICDEQMETVDAGDVMLAAEPDVTKGTEVVIHLDGKEIHKAVVTEAQRQALRNGGPVRLSTAPPVITKAAAEAVPQTPGGTPPAPSTTDLDTLVKTAVAEANKTHEAELAALRAELVKVKAQPVPGGPVLARPAQDIAKAGQRETLLDQATQYDRRAIELRPSDPMTASGYAQKAAGLRAEAAAL